MPDSSWIDEAAASFLAMVRLSGLRLIRNRDGWTSLEHAGLEDLGLADKDIRHRAVRKLVALGCLETRGINASGRKLEYRLTPNWADPPAQVIDLATVRTTRKRKS